MTDRPLLTIGVPTYNRAHVLGHMLLQLTRDVSSVASRVEIVVSDNASTDETATVIAQWEEQVPDCLRVRAVRNATNIGVSANLISLFQLASGRYFTFLGDDDRVYEDGLRRVLDLLEGEPRPSAVICTHARPHLDPKLCGELSYERALEFFYEYGNAWAGIIDSDAALQCLEDDKLREQIQAIVWPQTVIGFLAMHKLSDRPIVAVDFPVGAVLFPSLNITGKTYWMRSLSDLLMAATIVDTALGTRNVRRTLASSRSPGFLMHVKSVVACSLIEKEVNRTDVLQRILRRNFGVRGLIWALLVSLADRPIVLRTLLPLAYSVRTGRTPGSFKRLLAAKAHEQQTRLAQRADKKLRFGDWF